MNPPESKVSQANECSRQRGWLPSAIFKSDEWRSSWTLKGWASYILFGGRQHLTTALELTTISAGRHKICSSSPPTSYFNSCTVNGHVSGPYICRRLCWTMNTLYRRFPVKVIQYNLLSYSIPRVWTQSVFYSWIKLSPALSSVPFSKATQNYFHTSFP